jgi:hypothetical protein
MAFDLKKAVQAVKADSDKGADPPAPESGSRQPASVGPPPAPRILAKTLGTTGPGEPRNEHGQFVKGYGGNPSGRMKGQIPYIRNLSDDGREMLDHAFKVMRGEVEVPDIHFLQSGGAIEYVRKPSVKEQAESRNWLAERLWGKAPAQVEINVNKTERRFDLSKYNVEELLLLESLATKGLTDSPPASEIVDGEVIAPDSSDS